VLSEYPFERSSAGEAFFGYKGSTFKLCSIAIFEIAKYEASCNAHGRSAHL
jgi:hypothetical protein